MLSKYIFNPLIKITLVICFFTILQAHPHTFIYTSLLPEFEGNGIKGVWVEWTFDEMFSSQVFMEADANQNKKIDPDEIKHIYNNAFANLANYGYFFYQRVGDKRIAAKEVKNFSAWMNGPKIVYKFFVPVENKSSPLIISIIDSSFFCSLAFNKTTAVKFINPGTLNPKYSITPNQNYPVYYNPMGAIDDDRLYTKWQKGLKTAYPEEATITF